MTSPDIATEELSHLEMVGQALTVLMKGTTDKWTTPSPARQTRPSSDRPGRASLGRRTRAGAPGAVRGGRGHPREAGVLLAGGPTEALVASRVVLAFGVPPSRP